MFANGFLFVLGGIAAIIFAVFIIQLLPTVGLVIGALWLKIPKLIRNLLIGFLIVSVLDSFFTDKSVIGFLWLIVIIISIIKR